MIIWGRLLQIDDFVINMVEEALITEHGTLLLIPLAHVLVKQARHLHAIVIVIHLATFDKLSHSRLRQRIHILINKVILWDGLRIV